MRRTLIAGNWKMNGSFSVNATLLAEISAGLQNQASCDVVICPPDPYLMQCASALGATGIAWGGQNVSSHNAGAYTGEISAAMLADCGCTYVIVGHSERRAYHHESDESVAQKALHALDAGLIPIVCVGETLGQREIGRTNDVVTRQLQAVLNIIGEDSLAKMVVAYEPVWAIGTGKTATPQMAQEVHSVLRAQLARKNSLLADGVRIIYGGSMKSENARALLAMPDVDGGLIGGAALKSQDFLGIIKAA